jgi:hypothetical protein
MSVTIRGTDNSASTPAVTGTDGDTGLYFPATNQLALATNGTQAVIVDSSQNVNLGASSTVFNAKLGVTSSSAFPIAAITSTVGGSIFSKTTTGAANQILFVSSDSYNYGVVGVSSATGTATGDVFTLGYTPSAGAAATNVLKWDSAGRVTTPSQPSVWLINPSDISGTGVITNWTANTNVGSHYNSGTGAFTCPVAGTYYVAAMIWRNNNTVDYAVRKNGVRQARIRQSSTNDCGYSASLTLSCSASDTIDFEIVDNPGNNLYGATGYSQTLTSAVIYLLG